MRVEYATELIPAPEASSSIVDSDFAEEYGYEAGTRLRFWMRMLL